MKTKHLWHHPVHRKHIFLCVKFKVGLSISLTTKSMASKKCRFSWGRFRPFSKRRRLNKFVVHLLRSLASFGKRTLGLQSFMRVGFKVGKTGCKAYVFIHLIQRKGSYCGQKFKSGRSDGITNNKLICYPTVKESSLVNGFNYVLLTEREYI